MVNFIFYGLFFVCLFLFVLGGGLGVGFKINLHNIV